MSDRKKTPLDVTNDSIENKAGKVTSRRGFLKKTVLTGLAVAGTAAAAKKATEALLKEDYRRLYRADELGAERAWKGKKLVLMSRVEKEEMVAALVKSYEAGKK